MSQPDNDHDRPPGPSPRLERVIRVVFLTVVVVALVVVAWAAITTFQSNARVAHAKTQATNAQEHVNQGEVALKNAHSAHAGAVAALKNDEVQFGALPSAAGTVSSDEGQIIAAAKAGVKSTATDVVHAKAELPPEQTQLQSAKTELVAAESETRSAEVWLIIAIGGGVLAIVVVLVLLLYARRRRQHSQLQS